jgi:alkane 1-monooxygenase
VAPGWSVPAWFKRVNYSAGAFWVYGIAQAIALIFVVRQIGVSSPSLLVTMGWASSVGIMAGTAGITAAHELIHRRRDSDRALGVALLAMTTYAHFRIEHVLGHHKTFGTKDDHSSADVGESFPAFFGCALWGGLSSAWALERAYLKVRGLDAWSKENRMLHYAAIQLLLYVAVALMAGLQGAVFFLLQSFVAVHLLEAVNYVQHYGLRRDCDQSGRPRRPLSGDAWDSNDPVSTLLVFNLSTHSAHHVRPGETCIELSAEEAAPKLPASFFFMVFIALIPPIWHRVMDPRVEAMNRRTRPIDVGFGVALKGTPQ